MSGQVNQTTDRQAGILGIAARLFWMLFGNVILFISTVFILQHKGEVFHTADVVFWITVLALVVVRYLDIKLLGGLTATGTPALTTHWSRYVALLLICSLAVWAFSHAVNHLVVNR